MPLRGNYGEKSSDSIEEGKVLQCSDEYNISQYSEDTLSEKYEAFVVSGDKLFIRNFHKFAKVALVTESGDYVIFKLHAPLYLPDDNISLLDAMYIFLNKKGRHVSEIFTGQSLQAAQVFTGISLD